MNKREEEITIARFRSGQEAGYVAVYRHLHRQAHHQAFQMLQSKDEVKDVIAEVFWNLWKHRASFERMDSIAKWLSIAVFHACSNVLKHQQRVHQLHKRVEAMQYTAHPVYGLETYLVENELFNRVIAEVEKLPDIYRQVLQLSLQDYSLEEIAVQLGISKKTVSNRKTAAIERLRIALRHQPALLLAVLVALKNIQQLN
ncbi:MAG: sigma-70 family RNA polymerase sigma factor [Candidatus Pseudobacter hemicellulosilyticus]|uniref:Sigma-70 family RNA polymerase sigma factor n=1 Tax=Candidatus Pseudobacter hemicellulosilyticus TaxID=3121375 RepID=A0AAJ5WUU7_9BACT|nr:MAG: sigma-70 family RNA polymerase sigma factor [Pseudobacter sp.]